MNELSSSALRARRYLLLAFTLSGFAGLIYESIWSHYLKLMLGHAAQAQTLVLVLFMGGMALGAGLCGRYSGGLRRPLLVYAGVELVLGLFALSFDPMFRAVHGWFLDVAAPALGQPWAIEFLKWSLAGALILPACVLLGATFPLISAGVIRLDSRSSGNALGWLYFSNSLGAVAGVLTSGFVLIAIVGLPGTLMTAALCNFLLALVVYAINKSVDTTPLLTGREDLAEAQRDQELNPRSAGVHPLVVTAFLTGAASFLYEIGWIRMLSLVLGAATHSFELMLGAFILGLALGSLWVRNRIDRFRNPLQLLAWVQVLMGTVALMSLVVFGWSFDWMGGIVQTLAKTDLGYAGFTVLSQGICWALMLPVTFFAGMTLPLITALLLKEGAGEAAIGRVYAANTWGAIVGVVVAVSVAMPYLGLRNVVVLGAIVDLMLGIWLFSRAGAPQGWGARAVLAGCAMSAVAIAALARFDQRQLSSGVYRHGVARNNSEMIWYRDGRTASISFTRNPKTGNFILSTNGKTDASLNKTKVADDDYTQIATGAVPLTLKPDARSIAVIGMGSGRSSHVVLSVPSVREVHTIEIEPAMVEGARLFGPLVGSVFTDPRSYIHIEDAKTYFARHQNRYDLIISEPSNPWVSGVASLFSKEFYRQVKSKLADGGLLAQWIQLYEFDDGLLGSVIGALGSEFEDYAIYMLDETNLLIAAVPKGAVPEPDAGILQSAGLQPLARSIGLSNLDDLRGRRLGTRKQIEPFVRSLGVPPNSDYFPYVDQNAAEQRFKSSISRGLTGAHPVLQRLQITHTNYAELSAVPLLFSNQSAFAAFQLWAYLDWKHRESSVGASPTIDPGVLERAIRLEVILGRCNREELNVIWQPALMGLGEAWWPYLDLGRAVEVLDVLRGHACTGDERARVDRWLAWMQAISRGDWAMVSGQADALLAYFPASAVKPVFVVRETLLADYLSGGPAAVRRRVQALGSSLPHDASVQYLIMASAPLQGRSTTAVK